MYQPIENYGAIGNVRTIALAGMDGSIDWFCYPDIDSPSIFGAILDDSKGGRFRIAPADETVRRKQSYWPSTNILVTRFFNDEGIAELQDFMPLRRGSIIPGSICRRIRGVRGQVRFRIECSPAFDYGRQPHRVTICRHGARFDSPSLALSLSSSIPLREAGCGSVTGEFVLDQGQTVLLILGPCGDGEIALPIPSESGAEDLFNETVNYWRAWLSACDYRGRWREQVERSALILKLLTFQPTGAIVAAATCSLPEAIGAGRNWDYRYTWIRDAAFTVYAFLRIGFKEEAAAFIDWICKYVARDQDAAEGSHTLLTVRGELPINEQVLSH